MRIKKFMPLIIFILIVVAICTGIFLYYIFSRENIAYGEIDNTAQNASIDEAKNSTPIIINNILIGGVYNKKFISAEKVFANSTSISNIDLGIYTLKGKAGTYQLEKLEKSNSTGVIYASTSRLNYIEEYMGVIDSIDLTGSFIYEIDKSDKVLEEIIKKGISGHMLPNNSIKITSGYQGALSNNEELKIVTATSEHSRNGVYSAIIAQVDDKVIPIKINYIKDVNYSSSWPVYNLKFVYDINGDGINEIVIEEVDEFNVKYSIMEFKDNKFVEILSVKKAVK